MTGAASEANRGAWVWRPGGHDAGAPQQVLFRLEVDCGDARVESARIAITAESVYELHVNGARVAAGPPRGSPECYYVDEVDVAGVLTPGRNVLAVRVFFFGAPDLRPRSRMGAGEPGLLVCGFAQTERGERLDLSAPGGWRCWLDPSVTLGPETVGSAIGAVETVDGRRSALGWREIDFDDAGWAPAVRVDDAVEPRTGGYLKPRLLTASPIPQQGVVARRFARVCRVAGGADASSIERLLAGEGAVVVPAGATLEVEVDAGALTTAHPRVRVLGGFGAAVEMLGAESYVDAASGRKGVRDDAAAGVLRGNTDTYLVAGRDEAETYQPLLMRTFRFLRLVARAGDRPLTVCGLDYLETGYPLEVVGEFECDDGRLNAMWDVSVRTVLRCMHDIYVDCPYYEQLQYALDTRLQALYGYALAADGRLARKAIHDLRCSLLPSGMLRSRYPAGLGQVIPMFALHWILMVDEYSCEFGDRDAAREYFPTADAVLGWHERLIGPDGLVGAAPRETWAFVDWAPQWEEGRGVPAGGRRVPLAAHSLLYAQALQAAARLAEAAGRSGVAAEYLERAGQCLRAVRAECWSTDRQFFADAPGLAEFSQHAQILAVLTGLVDGGDATDLLDRALDPREGLATVSYAWSHFLFRALEVSGRYSRVSQLWGPWLSQLDRHLTTWVEEPSSERSDCHGWGAAPIYECAHLVLGVRASSPGAQTLRIAPHPGPLNRARGVVPTPAGPVDVAWSAESPGVFELQVAGLRGRPTDIVLPDGWRASVRDVDRFHRRHRLAAEGAPS